MEPIYNTSLGSKLIDLAHLASASLKNMQQGVLRPIHR